MKIKVWIFKVIYENLLNLVLQQVHKHQEYTSLKLFTLMEKEFYENALKIFDKKDVITSIEKLRTERYIKRKEIWINKKSEKAIALTLILNGLFYYEYTLNRSNREFSTFLWNLLKCLDNIKKEDCRYTEEITVHKILSYLEINDTVENRNKLFCLLNESKNRFIITHRICFF